MSKIKFKMWENSENSLKIYIWFSFGSSLKVNTFLIFFLYYFHWEVSTWNAPKRHKIRISLCFLRNSNLFKTSWIFLSSAGFNLLLPFLIISSEAIYTNSRAQRKNNSSNLILLYKIESNVFFSTKFNFSVAWNDVRRKKVLYIPQNWNSDGLGQFFFKDQFDSQTISILLEFPNISAWIAPQKHNKTQFSLVGTLSIISKIIGNMKIWKLEKFKFLSFSTLTKSPMDLTENRLNWYHSKERWKNREKQQKLVKTKKKMEKKGNKE